MSHTFWCYRWKQYKKLILLHSVLVGMQSGLATFEISLLVSYEIKHTLTV